MENYVARQLDESPVKAMDPQIELLQGMSREADLDSRPALVEQPDIKTTEPPPSDVEASEEAVPQTPDAEPQLPEASESQSAVAASPLVEHGSLPDPVLPVGSAAPDDLFTREPAPQDSSDPATPQEATESPVQPAVKPAEAPSFFTDPARAASLAEDHGVNIDVSLNGNNATETITPDALPIDFNQALNIARNEVELPTIVAGDKSLRSMLPDLPDFPDFESFDPQPSTEFAEAKLSELSTELQRWGRYV